MNHEIYQKLANAIAVNEFTTVDEFYKKLNSILKYGEERKKQYIHAYICLMNNGDFPGFMNDLKARCIG